MPHCAARCGLDYSESSQSLSIAYAMHNLREKSVHDYLRLFHSLHFWISLDLTTPIGTYLHAPASQQRLRTFPQLIMAICLPSPLECWQQKGRPIRACLNLSPVVLNPHISPAQYPNPNPFLTEKKKLK